MNIDAYLDEKYGIFDYLMEQKKKGRIRHLGFSAHGSYDIMKRFLDCLWQAYGILPDPAQLSGLVVPECQGKGRFAEGASYPCLGHGASARRKAGVTGG